MVDDGRVDVPSPTSSARSRTARSPRPTGPPATPASPTGWRPTSRIDPGRRRPHRPPLRHRRRAGAELGAVDRLRRPRRRPTRALHWLERAVDRPRPASCTSSARALPPRSSSCCADDDPTRGMRFLVWPGPGAASPAARARRRRGPTSTPPWPTPSSPTTRRSARVLLGARRPRAEGGRPRRVGRELLDAGRRHLPGARRRHGVADALRGLGHDAALFGDDRGRRGVRSREALELYRRPATGGARRGRCRTWRGWRSRVGRHRRGRAAGSSSRPTCSREIGDAGGSAGPRAAGLRAVPPGSLRRGRGAGRAACSARRSERGDRVGRGHDARARGLGAAVDRAGGAGRRARGARPTVVPLDGRLVRAAQAVGVLGRSLVASGRIDEAGRAVLHRALAAARWGPTAADRRLAGLYLISLIDAAVQVGDPDRVAGAAMEASSRRLGVGRATRVAVAAGRPAG